VHTVSREELYAQVWSKPMTKVAADYGVTGTALKKTCNRYQIPTPPLGYWAKLEHGKPVTKPDLPKLNDPRLQRVRVVGSPVQRLPEGVRSAKEEARRSLQRNAPPTLATGEAAAATEATPDAKILAATRRAISKARADTQGFATVQGAGNVPLKIAPASGERALAILNALLALAQAHGHEPRGTSGGLVLVVDSEAIAFSLEEQPQKVPHEPTAAELKQQQQRARWGYTNPPWPKYDHTPSGRLAIVINANPYSGLRRTYADGKTRRLEGMLSEVLAGFAEHAALVKERRRTEEERLRAQQEAEARRLRQAAFEAREKHRMEFADAVHEQLTEREKLSAVLSHLEGATGEDADRVQDMIAWLRRRIRQIDVLLSPRFLDISARAAKVGFEELPSGTTRNGGYMGHLPPVALQFWSIDDEKELATAATPIEWLAEAGLGPDLGADEPVPTEDDR